MGARKAKRASKGRRALIERFGRCTSQCREVPIASVTVIENDLYLWNALSRSGACPICGVLILLDLQGILSRRAIGGDEKKNEKGDSNRQPSEDPLIRVRLVNCLGFRSVS